MQSGLSSKYDEFNGNLTAYRNRVIRDFGMGFGGLALFQATVYYYPAPSVSSLDFVYRTVLISVGGILMLLAWALLTREKAGLESEQKLFIRTYRAASKLKEYVMDSSKVKARKRARKQLRLLCRRVDEEWALNFKLAKEALGPVVACVTDLRDKVLYSVEKGSHVHASNALAFVERFAWFLLKAHPTVQDLPNVGSLVLLERPPRKKTLIGRGMTWIRKQPGSKGIMVYSVVGAIVGFIAFETALSVGVDVNGAWGTAVTLFLFFLVYGWKRTTP